jgi:hypothetical protein
MGQLRAGDRRLQADEPDFGLMGEGIAGRYIFRKALKTLPDVLIDYAGILFSMEESMKVFAGLVMIIIA